MKHTLLKAGADCQLHLKLNAEGSTVAVCSTYELILFALTNTCKGQPSHVLPVLLTSRCCAVVCNLVKAEAWCLNGSDQLGESQNLLLQGCCTTSNTRTTLIPNESWMQYKWWVSFSKLLDKSMHLGASLTFPAECILMLLSEQSLCYFSVLPLSPSHITVKGHSVFVICDKFLASTCTLPATLLLLG